MLGLISVGLGISVLPHFEQVEKFRGIVWRPLTKPKLWMDWALIWRRQSVSPIVERFAATAEEQLPVPVDGERAEF
jgi:DNA-binding transcriptional LysR family regulator